MDVNNKELLEFIRKECKEAGIDQADLRVDTFIKYLNKYPKYAEEAAERRKKQRQIYGTVLYQNEDRNPDITYACGYAGIMPDFISRLEEKFYIINTKRM